MPRIRREGLRLLVIPIEFYFDFASPYGSLAAMQLDRIQRSTIGSHFCLALSTSRSASRVAAFAEARLCHQS